MSVLLRLASLRSLTRRPAQILLSDPRRRTGSLRRHCGRPRRRKRPGAPSSCQTAAITGRATHRIVSGGGGIDEDLYRQLRLAGAPGAMAPVIESHVRAGGSLRLPLRLFGIDPLAESELRPWLEVRGRAGEDGAGLGAFLTESNACLLSAVTARTLGVDPGMSFELAVGPRRIEAVLVGLIEAGRSVRAGALDDLLVCDVARRAGVARAAGPLDAHRSRLERRRRQRPALAPAARRAPVTPGVELEQRAADDLRLRPQPEGPVALGAAGRGFPDVQRDDLPRSCSDAS